MMKESANVRNIFCIIATVMLVALGCSDVQAAHTSVPTFAPIIDLTVLQSDPNASAPAPISAPDPVVEVASHHGSTVPVAVPSGPVLQSQAVNYGVLTPNGLGGVRLNSQDKSYGTKFNPFGLDLLVSGTCATWTTTFASGRASNDLQYIAANTPEGAGARTPTISATGVGHMTGDYVTNVSCKDAGGNSSNTVQLTYHSIANAVNAGTGDRNFSNWPAGFGSVAGAKFMFSTGASIPAGISYTMTFPGPNVVTVTWADPTRPGDILKFATGGTSQFVLLKDVTFTGTGLGANGNIVNLGGTGGGQMSADNVHAYFTSSTANIGTTQFFSGSLSGGTINNVGCEWCGTGMTPPPFYLITKAEFRYFQNNCFFLTNISHNTEIDDPVCASPQGNPAFHQDTFQFCDGCTPHDLTIKRALMIQADGNNTMQGLYFGGAIMNAVQGYVSAANGDGGGTSGKILTLTGGSLLTGANGATLYTPSGGGVGLADNITLTCAGGANCGGETTAVLSLASNISLGTAASPVTFYGKDCYNCNFDQIAFIGYTINGYNESGEGGTYNLSNFAYVYTQYPTQASIGGTVGGGVNGCEIPELHTGTATISGGFFWSGLGFNKFNPIHTSCAGPPANMTVTNVINGSDTPATITPLFLNGNPQTLPQNTSFAAYAALDFVGLKALACNDLQADPGHAFSGHSPFISGGWKDGTLISGCL